MDVAFAVFAVNDRNFTSFEHFSPAASPVKIEVGSCSCVVLLTGIWRVCLLVQSFCLLTLLVCWRLVACLFVAAWSDHSH